MLRALDLCNFGCFLVNALHQQEQVFCQRGQFIGNIGPVNSMQGLRSTGEDA